MTQPRLCNTAAAGLVLAALTAGAAGPSLAARLDTTPCRTVATQHLNDLGIASDDVAETSMIRIIGNPEIGAIVEYQAWTSLKSCRGNVVIKLSPFCRVKETYTRGRCRLPNVPRY